MGLGLGAGMGHGAIDGRADDRSGAQLQGIGAEVRDEVAGVAEAVEVGVALVAVAEESAVVKRVGLSVVVVVVKGAL